MSMRRTMLAAALSAGLVAAACSVPNPAPTATAGAGPTQGASTPQATTAAPADTATAPVAETGAPPTPTALVEGLIGKLSTPNPSPNCPDRYPWFFENTAAECADMVENSWLAWQSFERGVMVWKQNGGLTYVLVDDGSLFKPYAVVADLQGLPLPEPDPSLTPPEGLYQPERGFALFWRGLAPGSEWVRAALGWATAPEAAYSALWQCNRAAGNGARCYFTGPRDEIVSLTLGSAAYWNYWQRAVR
jgi:hypothetical protein